MVQRVIDTARASLRGIGGFATRTIGPILSEWWSNPLFRRARARSKLPYELLRIAIPIVALILAVMAILAWVLTLRTLGAVLMAISVGSVGLPMLIAPVLSADWTSRQMQSEQTDPRTLMGLDPVDGAWGLLLVMLWRFRWLIVLALAVTPALIIGTLHVRVSDYEVWQQSVEVLGTSRLLRGEYLTPAGGIPYFRLVVQSVTAALLLWVLLPLLTALGNTAALILEDTILSDLAALIGGGITAGILVLLWEVIARIPALGGSLEIVRLILLLAMAALILYITLWVVSLNASLIIAARTVPEPTIEEADEDEPANLIMEPDADQQR